jgi:hypothetical protein
MPVDTEPNPTRDRPFQYSLRTLLLIMTGLCVCLGLMAWNPIIGILSMGAVSLVIAVRMSRLERLVSVIVAIAIVVNVYLFFPCFAAGLGEPGSLVRDIWLLSGALVALINMVVLIVALREHVRWLNVIAFVANGYLLCLCVAIRFLLGDWITVLPTTTLFFMMPLNVLALLLANEYWREDSPLSRQSRGSRKSFLQIRYPAKK